MAWLWRRPAAGLPLALILATACALVAAALWDPSNLTLWMIAWVQAYLALKYLLVGLALIVRLALRQGNAR